MYGLPQAGILAQNLLEKCLNQHGYHQNKVTPGLWNHDWWPLLFTLCVDNFSIKYVGWEHANHLAKILKKHYICSIDWDGNQYLGMTMDWDYNGHKATSQCSYMSPRPSRIFNTGHPTNHSISHTHTSSPTTEQRCSTRKTQTSQLCSPMKTRNSFKRSLALSSTKRDALTAPCLQRWGLLPHNRQTQPKHNEKGTTIFRL
jgi:hypothetical protein